MLQSMRHIAQSWVVKGLMAILVVSFGIWGIGDMFRGNPLQRAVAKVGGDSITVQQLENEFKQTLQRARQMIGPDVTEQQARQMGLVDASLNALIERSLMQQDIQKLGLLVSDKTVYEFLARQPQFKDKDGKFDPKILRQMLAQAQLSEHEMVSEESKDLAYRQIVGLFSGDVSQPKLIVEDVAKARTQKRILEIASIQNSAVKITKMPSDKDLQGFYQDNLKDFTQPEYRGITIAVLSTDSVMKDIAISDDQALKEYQTKGDLYAHGDMRDIVQVVTQSEDKAKQIAKAAVASKNLTEAGKAEGIEAIEIAHADDKSLLPELIKPVADLKTAGQIMQPVKTDLGWHVIQLKKLTPAGKDSFDAIKNTIKDSMRRDQAVEITTHMVNQLDDELAAGHSLEDIADALKLRLIRVASVDAMGHDKNGKDPAELPNKDVVLKTAFAQNSGEVSPVIDDKAGGYFVVRTDEVTSSTPKPFDTVRADVITDWTAQEQMKQAAADAEKLAKALRDGKQLSSLTKDRSDVEVRVSRPVSVLGEGDPSLPAYLLPAIMKLKKGEVTTAATKDKQLVLRLAGISDAGATEVTAAQPKVAGDLQNATQREQMTQYLKYLRVVFPVTVKQDAIDSLSRTSAN